MSGEASGQLEGRRRVGCGPVGSHQGSSICIQSCCPPNPSPCQCWVGNNLGHPWMIPGLSTDGIAGHVWRKVECGQYGCITSLAKYRIPQGYLFIHVRVQDQQQLCLLWYLIMAGSQVWMIC